MALNEILEVQTCLKCFMIIHIKPLGSKNHIRKYKKFNQCSVFAAYISEVSPGTVRTVVFFLALYLYCLILHFIRDPDLLHATKVVVPRNCNKGKKPK